ncbi:RsiV family protein [uncultured Oscillibacter sp.]|uniref:RsiV family protein n=1 Tax=uncultured Oscillibacter sp. TaxID=876091 RepID=UPI00260001EC|nr:RsiV family protein [uncultured Oscillibacter sp.]
MNDFRTAKEAYENIPIPEELNERIQAGIRQGSEAYRRAHRRRALRHTLTTAAACFVVVVGALNLSPTVAAAAADVPVLGGLFRVLTVRSYQDTNGDRTVEVEQPAIEGGALARQATEEIQERVDEKIAQGEELIAQYKEAFLATGGTEEQWEEKNNTVSVTYDIKSQTSTTVSFVVDSYVSIASAYQEQVYYNLDLASDREITLADLLGENWAEICNESIRIQMAESEDPSVFFPEDMGGFTTVDETTSFYINEAGNPVVVFPKYTVAIGALGNVEFEIVK